MVDLNIDPLKKTGPGQIGGLVQPLEGRNDPNNLNPVQPEPVNKEWGKGDLNIGDDGVFYTPPGSETVEGRLEGILQSGSPYIEAAKAGAQRQSKKRGLLNSTMAATAGEKAGIESALPIAQQDAGYLQQRGLNTQQGDISSRLQSESGDITSRLQREQGGIQEGLYETQGNISSRLQSEQGDIQQRLAAAGYTQETAMRAAEDAWNATDLQARMDIERERLSADNRDKFNEMSGLISEDFQNDLLDIMLNPNFATTADRQRATDILVENTRIRYEIAGVVSGAELKWDLPEDNVPEYADLRQEVGPDNANRPNAGESTRSSGTSTRTRTPSSRSRSDGFGGR